MDYFSHSRVDFLNSKSVELDQCNQSKCSTNINLVVFGTGETVVVTVFKGSEIH
jgi:hypothetical protein